MASSSRFKPSRLGSSDTKDVFLQHVFTDIKGIHDAQCDISTHMDVLTDNEKYAQLLCDHLDHILMHGLYRSSDGYWPCVAYYTHKFTVEEIRKLVNVATGIGKGRAWLNIALNEQVLESYLRMFIENQRHIKLYYTKEAFLRDVERLSLLLTMIAGLDYVSFNLPTDVPYLDMSASPSVANSGIDFSIKPNFIGSVTPLSLRKMVLTTSDDSHTPSSPVHDTSTHSKLTSSLPTKLIARLTSSNVQQSPAAVPEDTQTTSTGATCQTPTDTSISQTLTDTTSHSPIDTPSHTPTDSSSHTPSLPSIDRSSHDSDLPSVDTTSHTPGLHSTTDTASHTPSLPSIDTTSHTPDLPSTSTSSHTPTASLTGQLPETTDRGSPPPSMADTEKTDSLTKQQPKLSFIDRFNQLSVQEEEKTSELVSRKKKATKGKKKKKKKDTSAESKNTDGSSTNNQPPQTLDDSVKENQAPEVSVPDIEQSLEVTQTDESSNSKPLGTIEETGTGVPLIVSTPTTQNEEEITIEPIDTTVQTSVDDPPLNDDQSNTPTALATVEESVEDEDNKNDNVRPFVVEPPRKTSHDYQFGMTQSIEPMMADFGTDEDMELLGRAGSLVREKRRSPQPSSRLREDVVTGDDNKAIEKVEYVPEISEQQEDILNKEDIDGASESSTPPQPPPTSTISSPPKRPMEITETEKKSYDMTLDDNTRIVLSLDVFHHSKEIAVRLVQAYVPQGPGRYQKVCVVLTNSAVYITQHDGTEGVFSHMTGVQYSDLDMILIGLGWQSFTLVYNERINAVVNKQKQVVITGSEAVSRSIVDSVKTIAKKSIPLKRSDELHLEAIERELIKLGSETSMEIVRYCLVYWEQLSGEPPLLSPPADISVPISGMLHVKELSLFMIQTWSAGYFQLIDGVLYHFSSDTDKTPKSSYPLRGLKCGGCTRAAGETKENAFKVLDSNGSSLVLAADDEEDMTRWMQALCLASIGEKPAAIKSPIQKGGSYCAVLLTQNKIHVLREDWSNETVQLVTSISVQDINEICVEQSLPVYCTLKYDDWENETQGMWMLCFSSEYELGQFEQCLLKKYKEIFQVDLGYSELSDESTLSRAHDAIELFRASWSRSDSITRGRTVFTFDND